MSRHRNVRNMNYDEECDVDDVYGRSVEDDYCISPNTAAQFMYDRSARSDNVHSISAFIGTESDIAEEGVDADLEQTNLSDLDKARLLSCLDELRSIVGETIPEQVLVSAVLRYNFDVEQSLNSVLSASAPPEQPKPQRQPRGSRRNAGTANGFSNKEDEFKTFESFNNGDNRMTTDESRITKSSFPANRPVVRGFSPAIDEDLGAAEQSRPKPYVGQTSKNGILGNESEMKDTASVLRTLKPSPDKDSTASDGDASVESNVNSSFVPKPTQKIGNASRIDAQAEYVKARGDGKELLNLVVIGHVDAGKSTLMGHLLCLLGSVTKKTMHKYEQDAKKIGKASFMYAWVLDETGEERSRGITMDVGQHKFETASKAVTLLDAPGHKDFIPNMITGAAQADVAILVVDATRGEFETGFESGGQTREHALLVRSLGVSQLVVAINKLDTVAWSQERFDEIARKLGQFLKHAGFKDADITCIPCSGLTGENLTEQVQAGALRSWYNGPTLLQQIDNFRVPERLVKKPFRMTIGDVFKGQGSGFCVSGRVETGLVHSGDRVLVMPQAELAQVKSIAIDNVPVLIGFAGDHATLTLSNIEVHNLSIGSVICDPNQPIRSTVRVQSRVVIFNIDIPITKGFPVIFHYQTMSESAIIKKLISQLHKSTGEVVRKKPRCLGKQSIAMIEVEIGRPVCVELYKDIKELGRFMLRSGGHTIAAGLITEIL